MKQRLSLVLLIAAVVVGVLSIGLSAVSAQATTVTVGGAYLGVQISAADNGAKVELVAADSPAALAGLEVGDIITEVDGTAVTFHELHAAIMSKAAGDKLSLSVLRGEETLTIEVTLAERPADMVMPMQPGQGMGGAMGGGMNGDMGHGGMGNGMDMGGMMQGMLEEMHDCMMQAMPEMQDMDMGSMTPEEMQSMMQSMTPEQMQSMMQAMQGCMGSMGGAMGGGMNGDMGHGAMGGGMDMGDMGGMMMMGGHGLTLGVEYADLNETSAKEYNAPQTTGALIVRVLTGSAAEKAGLLGQDIIVAINGEAVDAEHLLADRLIAYEAGDEITIDVIRAGETQQIKVTLEAMSMSGMMDGMPQAFFFSQAVPGGMGMGGMNGGMGHGHGSMGGGMGMGSGMGSGSTDTNTQGANT